MKPKRKKLQKMDAGQISLLLSWHKVFGATVILCLVL